MNLGLNMVKVCDEFGRLNDDEGGCLWWFEVVKGKEEFVRVVEVVEGRLLWWLKMREKLVMVVVMEVT
jgi:hypothetical protein